MTVDELITNLINFREQSPDAGFATVALQMPGGVCYQVARGDQAHGLQNERCLFLVADGDNYFKAHIMRMG